MAARPLSTRPSCRHCTPRSTPTRRTGAKTTPGSPTGSGSSDASPALSWPRPVMAASWLATRPECRSGRPRPGGRTLPDEVTAEHPGRTFALTELLVRASWRRQGIGHSLHDLILSRRGEERATLTVHPAAGAAQNAFQSWGWQKVARTRDSRPGSRVSDVLVTALPAGRAP